jgi:formylglycine-generating enzyme required for sulfatase activity
MTLQQRATSLGFVAVSLLAASLAISACGPGPAPPSTATPIPPTPAPTVAPTPAPTPPPATALGDTQTRRADQMTLVYVPAGQFQMGSDLVEGRYARQLCKQYSGPVAISVCQPAVFANEQPAHSVTLHDFWIDRTEVTNAMYQRCEAAGACAPPEKPSSYARPSYYGNSAYAAYPVIWVNWQQAADYCRWAGGRLPTEAEWEYAARGPHSWVFPWGDEFDGTRLNYCDASCATGLLDEAIDDGYPETAPVGEFPKGVSWCGALDMAGNVREWVADWFAPYTLQPQVNPTGPRSGKSRIPRGGSWLDRPDDVRSANRGENTPDYTRHKVGFRCVVDVTQP